MPQPNAVKCMVVDDEPRLRRVLVRLLEGEGFSCSEAGSGTEALEMLQHDPVPLVISDLRMPQMDGVTLLREIIARWPTTAVIVVTAVAEVESAVACLQLGALDYVAKPFHLDEVRARVMQALDKRSLKMEVEDYRRTLEERVQEQARRIEELSLREPRVRGARSWAPLMRAVPRAHQGRQDPGPDDRVLHDVPDLGAPDARRADGACHRSLASRAARRQRVSRRLEGRPDPARSADRGRGRLVRRDDERPPVPARPVGAEGTAGARGWERNPVPSPCRRGVPRCLPRPVSPPGDHARGPAAPPPLASGRAPPLSPAGLNCRQ